VNNLKDRTITPVEETAIFAAAEKRRQQEPDRAWFRFIALLETLWDTAGRLGETLGLGPTNVARIEVGDREVSFVTFPRYRTKNGKPRTLPLTQRVVDTLGSMMDHLVLDKETGEWRFFGIKNSTAWYMFNQVKEDVMRETGMDLSDVTLHTIRHTTLTRLAQGGMDLARLQEWAGHSDPKITAERYLHLIPNDLVRGLDILAGTNGTQETIRYGSGNKPGNVSVTRRGGKGATPGTVTVQ
jgi:integrase